MPLNCPIVLAGQTPAQTMEGESDNIRGYGDRGRDDQTHTHIQSSQETGQHLHATDHFRASLGCPTVTGSADSP